MPATGRPFPILIGSFVLLAFLIGNHVSGQGGDPGIPPKILIQSAGQQDNQRNFQNAPVNTVLDLYEQLSGKHFIRDSNLSGVPPVSVNYTGQSKDEALKLIAETLLLNGVAILSVDERTLKAVTIGTNKNPRSEGLKVYANEADLPNNDEIVTYYLPLTYINPQEAVGIFVQVAPPHVYGAYVPAPSAQAVVLTENVSVIRQLIELKKLIDVRNASGPPHGPPHRSFPLTGTELILLFIVIVVAVAAGNFLACLWLRKSRVNETRT